MGKGVEVGIDWHNTLEVVGRVPQWNTDAIMELRKRGVGVNILSFMGRDSHWRRQEFYKQSMAWVGAGECNRIMDCTSKVGEGGKLELYKQWGVSAVFDDSDAVCKECVKGGFAVFPIRTRYEKHAWATELGMQTYESLAEAIQHYLAGLKD